MKKIAIIGSGPAGLTAAIYASRASLDVTCFTGPQPGGQLIQTTDIENFPGFEHGIGGGQLMHNMLRQAERFGTRLLESAVDTILPVQNQGFLVQYDQCHSASFDAVIVATGSTPKLLGIPSEHKWFGIGLHTCATCDGFFYRGKEVAVVGGGDTAMEEASYLAKLASKVYLIHRSDSFKASPIMLERCRKTENIVFLTHWQVKAFIRTMSDEFAGVILEGTRSEEELAVEVPALFVAIGHTPNTGPVKFLLTPDMWGCLKPEVRTMSEIPGVFIAGDVADHQYRQAITAAGDGAKAAIDCQRWLEHHG